MYLVKSVHLAFVDLEKAYESVLGALLNVFELYEVKGKLAGIVKNFYEVKLVQVSGERRGWWFPAKVGLRQG